MSVLFWKFKMLVELFELHWRAGGDGGGTGGGGGPLPQIKFSKNRGKSIENV